MNPLQVLFFLAIFIDDFFFKSRALSYTCLGLLTLYSIFYLINHKRDEYYTFHRKLLISGYNQSTDPTVYCKIFLDMAAGKEYMERYNKKYGKSISWTHYYLKVIGKMVSLTPEINTTLKFGKMIDRGENASCMLVNVEGGNSLGLLKITDLDSKTFGQIIDETVPKAKVLREGKDENFKKQQSDIGKLPTFIIGIILEVAGFLQNIGLNVKSLNVIANQFGTFIITSVGSLGIKNAYAPLCPFTRTAGVMTICKSRIKKILQKDGTYEEVELLPVNFAMDHRGLDGVLGGKILKNIYYYFSHPDEMEKID